MSAKIGGTLIILFVVLFAASSDSQAGVPLHLHGWMDRAGGDSALDGHYPVSIEVRTNSSPWPLWSEQDTLRVRNGRFALQAVAPDSVLARRGADSIDVVLASCLIESPGHLRVPTGTLLASVRGVRLHLTAAAPPLEVLDAQLTLRLQDTEEPMVGRILEARADTIVLRVQDRSDNTAVALCDIESVAYVYRVNDEGLAKGAVGMLLGMAVGAGLAYVTRKEPPFDYASGDRRTINGGVIGGLIGAAVGYGWGTKFKSLRWEPITVEELTRLVTCRFGQHHPNASLPE